MNNHPENLPSMIFCLNPSCRQPQNPDTATICQSCHAELIPLLRGRYRVVQLIGQGGFGRTYLAQDEDRLCAPCVIKQFSPQFHSSKSLDKAIDLFDQEARRLYELGGHSQIPALLAYFEHYERLYLVQEFIQGPTLSQELQRQGPFSEQKIYELLAGMLPVLKFIHERQVIHRDITPGNIIRRATDGKLVLIDFGVAKQLTGDAEVQVGTRIGTEGYSPIEQWRSGKAYPASDLYSLGATCIHLLTQLRPDVLYEPMSGSWLWRENLAKKGVNVSDRLARILNRLLKDMVNERYQSADEVLRDLDTPLSPNFLLCEDDPDLPIEPLESISPLTSKPLQSPPSNPPTSQFPVPPPASRIRNSQVRSNQPTSAVPVVRPSGVAGQSIWQCVQTIPAHPSWVTAVSISPDGQFLATGGLDDTIKVWKLASGELLMTLQGHTRTINCLTISPNNQILISGSDDDTIKIWHLGTGQLIYTLTGHTRDVNAVVVTPNGLILISGSEDRTVRLWNLNRGELVRTSFGTAGMVKTIALSPNGQILASGGLDNKVKLWRFDTGELLRTLSGHFNSVLALSVSPNSQVVASGGKDKVIKLWHIDTGDLLQTLSGHADTVNTLKIHPNGETLISGSSDRTLRVWHLETGELLQTITQHSESVNALDISADGQILASGSKDKTVKIWQCLG